MDAKSFKQNKHHGMVKNERRGSSRRYKRARTHTDMWCGRALWVRARGKEMLNELLPHLNVVQGHCCDGALVGLELQRRLLRVLCQVPEAALFVGGDWRGGR